MQAAPRILGAKLVLAAAPARVPLAPQPASASPRVLAVRLRRARLAPGASLPDLRVGATGPARVQAALQPLSAVASLQVLGAGPAKPMAAPPQLLLTTPKPIMLLRGAHRIAATEPLATEIPATEAVHRTTLARAATRTVTDPLAWAPAATEIPVTEAGRAMLP